MNSSFARSRTAAAGAALLAMTAFLVGVTGSPAAAAPNACTNPVLATNLNGWGSLDGSWVTRDQVGDLPGVSWAFDTGGREFYMPQVGVVAGQTWTFSAQDRVVFGSGTARIIVEWYGSNGQYLSENQGPTTALPAANPNGGGQWYPVSATATAPAGATSAHVLQTGDFGSTTGTNFKATACDYQLGGTPPVPSDSAAVRNNWGSPVPSQSDEYNSAAIDLTKWGLFGADPGQTTGCAPGYNGHGQRCASQTTQANGRLSVNATADGRTGGLYSRMRPFRYGRIEVRERAAPLTANGGRAYHAVPLLWPENDAQWQSAEIDFAERDVNSSTVELFVHHNNTQTSRSKTIDSTQFHNYAIDWEPGSVKWYVDGVQVGQPVNASITEFSSSNGGAQLDMFPATGTLMRPAVQEVDWIRMYANQYTQYR
ncbi:Glycosyl hydrolases family 16 [Asanoa hainanensis]|uniref:Glycosyl hydrolases family 16 n=1 Tax=Asanoa hainanensis TaxID=560556 RepID=A0A239PAY7_9ACTN|nr:glycoside hydrolase family 16 protein [Asanoa hainanensis]SNT63728.1 Glycosyl hydrolases family 16 [Asanoa hainanensis]